MNHFATPDFWHCYRRLPVEVRELADKNFALLRLDPHYPSLQLNCTFRRNLTSPYHPQQAGEQGGEFPGEALAELSGEKLQLEAAAP